MDSGFHNHLKSLNCLMLLVASIAFPFDCLVSISVEQVTKERAESLGLSFKMHNNGDAGYAVTMDFSLKGK